ncbi:PaaX family transcriptional regulator C-terminal domain-containing protein [Sinisalibacter aestuarii]|uniref:Phenylacetic acid degradation operon negative regulatory protein n=1 Tax=Sinisalibacter aestuarii TaxID=2949426 RepID=A0ABQ5LQC4_9RHOB|nr:PaaX family transcriptional regulator C-terminal domain-containing protein [Sinisalibacter aestuarii]GKY87210.1 phenylacetic acid degradation operon negative regulatory protein [Sinisalibacter aestuarii]
MSTARVISALTRDGEPRTWSLIVTAFGDLARSDGAELSGPVLSAITGRIGVRPEAMRVALHRLRKDGWIASRRAGRVSYYRLTPAGRAEAQAASPRIYATGAPAPETWHILVAGPTEMAERLALESRLAAEGYVALAPGAWLGPGEGADREGLLRLAGPDLSVPGWLRAANMPPELAAAYASFAAHLDEAETALAETDPAALSDLDRAALRVLIVHGWRRLVLRHPALPDALFPADWRGAELRRRVAALLDAIGHPALDRIEPAPVLSGK